MEAVVAEAVRGPAKDAKVPERILELESKSLDNIDFCIQHVLPHHLVGTKKFKKNIAFFVGESDTIKYNLWYPYLKNVDSVWVPNNTNTRREYNTLLVFSVRKKASPIKFVSHTTEYQARRYTSQGT